MKFLRISKLSTKYKLIINVSWYSYEALGEELVNSEYFLPAPEGLTGKKLQYNTIFGRMLSVTVWPTENSTQIFKG